MKLLLAIRRTLHRTLCQTWKFRVILSELAPRIMCLTRCALLAALFTPAPLQAATFSGHYPAGAEGLKAATLPPPGFYVRDYSNTFYYRTYFASGPPDFKAWAYIQAPRAIWITDFKIFGANYGLDLLIPFYYGNVQYQTPAGKLHDTIFTMGDLQFEPLLLSWHLQQLDIGAGYAFWAPTGDSNTDGKHPARLLGKVFGLTCSRRFDLLPGQGEDLVFGGSESV